MLFDAEMKRTYPIWAKVRNILGDIIFPTDLQGITTYFGGWEGKAMPRGSPIDTDARNGAANLHSVDSSQRRVVEMCADQVLCSVGTVARSRPAYIDHKMSYIRNK